MTKVQWYLGDDEFNTIEKEKEKEKENDTKNKTNLSYIYNCFIELCTFC